MIRKKVYYAFLLIVVLIIVSGCSNKHESPFLADALYFIEAVEITHPIFGFPDMLADDYEDIRSAFLESAARAECRTDFNFAMLRYIRVLQDGHMSANNGWRIDEMFAAIPWDIREGGLFLLEDIGIVGAEVLMIGGVPVSDIFDIIERYFFFENEADRRKVLVLMSRNRAIHKRAGIEVNESISITLADGNEISFYYLNAWEEPDIEQTGPSYIIRYEMLGDIFFISLRAFQFCQDAHIETTAAIRNAVREGNRHFIIDLRGNPGGNADVGLGILQAMGLIPPRHGIYRRTSPLAREQRQGYGHGEDGETWLLTEPSIANSHNRDNVVIAVLTDILSYSGSTMMATWVQDGGFGVIIGEPSSNSPTAFGDMLIMTLPYSDMQVQISCSKFLRPDVYADQQTLWPDIPVESHLALEAALEFFETK